MPPLGHQQPTRQSIRSRDPNVATELHDKQQAGRTVGSMTLNEMPPLESPAAPEKRQRRVSLENVVLAVYGALGVATVVYLVLMLVIGPR